MNSRLFFESLFQGVVNEIFSFLQTWSSSLWQCPYILPEKALIAPSLIDRDLSGITRFGLISIIFPNPLHFGHAPIEVLNENADGFAGKNLSPVDGERRPS